MAQEGYPFINSPTSGWQKTTPYGSTIARQIRTSARQQLQQEAAALVPDGKALTESLLKHELTGGDRMYFSNLLNTTMNDYVTNYNENPYYAFTKKGKDQAKEMQRLVNHPAMASLSQANKLNDDIYKKASEKGNLNKVNVKNNRIAVLNKEASGGEYVEYIDSDSFDKNRHEFVTTGQIINFNKERGFFNPANQYSPNSPMDVDMASTKEVTEAINAILANPGSTEHQSLTSNVKGLETVLGVDSKNNYSQIEKKAKALFSEAGLSPEYWDSMLSNVYTNSGKSIPTKAEAYTEATKFLLNLVYSREDTKSGYNTILGDAQLKKNRIDDDEGSKGSTPVGNFEAALQGMRGVRKTESIVVETGGQHLNGLYWDNPYTPLGNDASLPLLINPLFSAILSKEEQIKTLDGKVINNPNMVLPNIASGIKVAEVPGDKTSAYLVFDAFVEEDAMEDDVSSADSAQNLSDYENTYIRNVITTLHDKAEKDNPRLTPGTRRYDEWFTTDPTFYKVPLVVKIDVSSASEQLRTLFDKNSYSISKTAYNLSGSEKTEESISARMRQHPYED